MVAALRKQLPGSTFTILDVNKAFTTVLQHPLKYGMHTDKFHRNVPTCIAKQPLYLSGLCTMFTRLWAAFLCHI